MPAEVVTVRITRYDVECRECDLHLPGTRRQSRYNQQLVNAHNKYCHGPEPLAHKRVRWDQNLVWLYIVDCICGKTVTVNKLEDWRCPLDRTIIEA